MPILRYVLYGLFFMTVAMAQGGSLGYITKMETVVPNSLYNIWYTVVYIDDNDTTPNPCYGFATCQYGFTAGMRKKAGATVYGIVEFPVSNRMDVNAVNARTMGEVGKLFKSKFSLPMSGMTSAKLNKSFDSTYLTQTCFGLFRIAYGPTYIGNQGYPVNGATCGLAPPPIGKCQLVGDIVLDHGTVNSDHVDGNQTSTTAYLECNQAMSIKVTATGVGTTDVVLRADGSLSASLQVNGVAGKTGANVDVPANTKTSVKFTSVLKTKGAVAAGPFTGSGTAVLSIP